MEAIFLAGGFGTRLKPLTYTRAKPLLPILNKPMILYLIDSLPSEVDRVILAVNYKKEQIEKCFSKYDCGREIIINEEPEPLGTGGAVKFAEKYLGDRFFVLNSDIISSINLQDMIRFHERNKATATISLWPVDNVSEFGVAEVGEDGRITGFVEKPKPEDAPSNLINAGAYLLESEVLDYIETGRLVSMEKEIFPQIISNTGRFYGYKFEGYWIDIGRIKSYLYVNQFLLKEKGLDKIIGEDSNVKGDIVNSILGRNVNVGRNTVIKSSVIFDNVSIDDNVTIENSVIGENCRIKENVYINNAVIGDNETIMDGYEIIDTTIWTQPIPEGYPKKQIGNVIGE